MVANGGFLLRLSRLRYQKPKLQPLLRVNEVVEPGFEEVSVLHLHMVVPTKRGETMSLIPSATSDQPNASSTEAIPILALLVSEGDHMLQLLCCDVSTEQAPIRRADVEGLRALHRD